MIFGYEQDLTYSAILGNGKFNAALAGDRFARFFYPIDVAHDARLRLGSYTKDGELEWFDFDTLKLKDGILNSGNVQFFMDSEEPALAIRVNSENPIAIHWAMRILCSTTENSVQFTNGTLAFFRRNNWFALKAPFSQHTCGHMLEGQIEKGKLEGADIAMRDCEAAAILEPNPEIYIAAGDSLKSVTDTLKRVHYVGYDEMLSRTAKAWEGPEGLIKSSAFVLSILQGESGAVLAAPEFDPEYRYSGGYGYCWPRDASYVVRAYDLLGMERRSDALLNWLAKVGHKGNFNQRYHLDGTLGPAWSNQIDQIGAFIWALEQHHATYLDSGLLKKLFYSVEDKARYLVDFLYSPGLTVDLWEERTGVHAYSCASIYGGLKSAHRMAKFLGYERENWDEVAEELKKEFVKLFYEPEEGIFARTVASEKQDPTLDSSIIGIAVPFGIIAPNDPRMIKTVNKLEEELLTEAGLKRYSMDKYPKENGVWPLCTAWLSWYYSALGDREKAETLLSLVEKCKSDFGFFPEQVNDDFSPRWAMPLAWSHGMYLIARDALGKTEVNPETKTDSN
ncbi:MAG: glycoside hydrolase family 15 protein [Candidatus Micrarchaeota archaeon]